MAAAPNTAVVISRSIDNILTPLFAKYGGIVDVIMVSFMNEYISEDEDYEERASRHNYIHELDLHTARKLVPLTISQLGIARRTLYFAAQCAAIEAVNFKMGV